MITFIYGENQFRIKNEIDRITREFNNPTNTERFDEDSINEAKLADALTGLSLFASEKLVILKNISANTTLWNYLDKFLDAVGESIHLVVVESHPDKRTKTFKHLVKLAQVVEAKHISQDEAIEWLMKSRKELDRRLALRIVERIGTDQLQLQYVLDKLVLFKKVTEKNIDDVIEPTTEASIFELIDAVMKGDVPLVDTLVRYMKRSQDAYQVFGLLTSQVFYLATIYESPTNTHDIARDLGVHPYPLQKLSAFSRKLNKKRITLLVENLTSIDDRLKRSGSDQWTIVETGLLRLSQLMK